MKVKLNGPVSSKAEDALARHAHRLYTDQGARAVALVEFRHFERTQPAPDEDKSPTLTLAISSLEIGTGDQEHHIREALRALYLQRTARGTLDEETGDVALSDRTLEMLGDLLNADETARLRVVVEHWRDHIAELLRQKTPPVSGLLAELRTIRDGLTAALGTSDRDGI